MLQQLSRRKTLRVVGVMSGSSCDGVTCAIALCRRIPKFSVQVESWKTYPFPAFLRKVLLRSDSFSAAELNSLDFYLGRFFAEAVVSFREELDCSIDLIASHGHTIVHSPPPGGQGIFGTASTWQIGEASTLAHHTELPVVADFRCADIALGGQGAPLVPFFDHIAFRRRNERLLLLNLGGIANVTLVPWQAKEVIGFDTGPGNALLDWYARRKLGVPFDHQGQMAQNGKVDQQTVELLLANPFFAKPPPKSIHRDYFGADFVLRHIPSFLRRAPQNALATLAAVTTTAIHQAYQKFIREHGEVSQVLVGGGGVHNQALMSQLERAFAPIPVASTQVAGVPAEAREAASFALMGACTIWGIPNHLPQVTGASRATVLGKIALPG